MCWRSTRTAPARSATTHSYLRRTGRTTPRQRGCTSGRWRLARNHANNLINYANFLTDVRQDYAAAEALYKRAMEVDPGNADRLRDYANFLTNIRQDFATAGLLYKRAQEIDPDEVNEFGY